MLGHALGALVAIACVACGPIQYIANVPLEAAGAVAHAKQVHADKHAPYEITVANEYLHKARELAGFGRFQAAVEYGRKATEFARNAQRIAEQRSHTPDEGGDASDDTPPPLEPELRKDKRPEKKAAKPVSEPKGAATAGEYEGFSTPASKGTPPGEKAPKK